jgi:hypothetical protein
MPASNGLLKTVLIPHALHQALKVYAAAHGTSIRRIMREAISEKIGYVAEPETVVDRTCYICGKTDNHAQSCPKWGE